MVRICLSRFDFCLFRFIGLLPEGATLAIVVYGETASLVLPPTTVTEEKREGLHGRVPRRFDLVWFGFVLLLIGLI